MSVRQSNGESERGASPFLPVNSQTRKESVMFQPENELGVIVLFAQQAEQAGFEIVSIQSAFPDAVVRRGGIDYRAEFEYVASAFRAHGHDARKVDIIICWKRDAESVLPILALSELDWAEGELILPTKAERGAEYWEQRAQKAERGLKALEQDKAQKEQQGIQRAGSKLGNARETVRYFASNPTATHAQAANELGISRRTVGNHLARAETQGAIQRGEQGVMVLWEVL